VSVEQFVYDERAWQGWRTRRPCRLSSQAAPAWAESPPDLAAEVANAAEGARVLDLLGRALVLPDYRNLGVSEANSQAAEAAYEAWRERLSEEWGVTGLVSLPTSVTRAVFRKRSTRIAQAATAALRDHLGAFETGTDAGKVAALRRAVGFSARVHCTAVDLTARCVMVTLTYRDGRDWEPCHLSRLVRIIREWCRRRDVEFRYCWVAELQKRGAIHYHLALWLPADVRLPRPDEAGWWVHGMSNVTQARGAVQYLMKYLSKGNKKSDHTLPGGARSYGCGGLGLEMRQARRWLSLPGFIKARADVRQAVGWRRVAGGGWADPDGVIWPSEFERQLVGQSWCLVRVRDHGRPAQNDGVFSAWPRQVGGV
jgi:hypothetical protein